MPYVETNGVSLYYEISGSGQPLLVIMGLGCSARMWAWMEPLLALRFTVIRFDNRGAGRSDKPAGDYSTELFASDVYGLMVTLGIERTHVFGVSVGGMIAQRFALMFPRAVDRLVLGCTLPNFSYAPPPETARQALMESALLPPEASVEKILPLFLSPSYRKQHPEQADRLERIMVQDKRDQGPDAFMQQFGAAVEHDMHGEIVSIAAPTLVISGDSDPMAPFENSRFLASRIPRSSLLPLDGAFHGFFVERSVQATEAIVGFLTAPS